MLTAILLLAGLQSASWGDDPASLEAAGVRVTVERKTGQLLSLKSHGVEMLHESSPQWTVRLTNPASRQSEWLNSGQEAPVRVLAGGGRIRADWYRQRERLSVRVEWKAAPRDEGLVVRCFVSAPPGRILESVTCPLLILKAAVSGDREGTRLFMPGGDGFIATHAGMVKNPWCGRTYPGWASMQFMALYGPQGGLTVQVRDQQALPKAFEAPYDGRTDTVEMRVVHQFPFVVGRGFTTSPIVVATCGPSWQSAADRYKRWARKQWWARRKSGAVTIPAWLNDPLLTVGGHLRPLGIGKRAVELDQWPQFVRNVQSALGVPSVLVDLREWEHAGIYTSPFYFPFYPSDAELKRLLSSLRSVEARSTAMVSGLQWMIERKAYVTDTYNITAFDGRDRFVREGRAVCVVNREGQVDVAEPYFTWDGTKARMCPAHPFTQRHFAEVARRLAEAGFTMFEFDQMNGGHCPPCYSTAHGHEPGPGKWMREAIAQFMAAVRRTGRSINPEFATAIEDPCEAYLPYLDAYVSRAAHTSEWPANGEGTEVVPAFAYVYNPLARPICLDVQHSVNPDPYQLILTARAFVGGCVPSTNLGLFGVYHRYGRDDLMPTPDKLDPAQRTLLASVTRARSGPLRPFVNHGEMVACEPPAVPDRLWRFKVWDGKEMVDKTLLHPTVLAGAWRMGQQWAITYVNMVEVAQSFPFRMPANFGSGKPTQAQLWLNDRLMETRSLARLDRVEVPPLSVITVTAGK